MKPVLPFTVFLVTLSLSAPLFAQAPATPKTDKEKLGYALGVDVGQTLKKQPIDFDAQFFVAAVRDTLTGGQPQMTEDQVKDVLTAFTNDLRSKQQSAMSQRGEKNKADGAAFLAANKAKPGVVTLPSGLQYKVLTEGSGVSPKATDTVTVKYRGTLTDGTEFDNSEKHPPGTVSFPVNGVIKGWTEALQKMKVGSKWQLTIPADLAYGNASPPGSPIPPGATLLFDVELVSIGQ